MVIPLGSVPWKLHFPRALICMREKENSYDNVTWYVIGKKKRKRTDSNYHHCPANCVSADRRPLEKCIIIKRHYKMPKLLTDSTVTKRHAILTYGMHQLVCDNTNMVTSLAEGDFLSSNRSISFPNFG